MKLNTKAIVTVLAIEKKDASGEYRESYKIAIMQGSETGSYSCTKDVYETLKDAEMFKPYAVDLAIGEYKGESTFRIIGATKVPTAPTGTK